MLWTTPSDWPEITDARLSALLDRLPWSRDLHPSFQLYIHATTKQPFAASYGSGRIFCHPDYATEIQGSTTDTAGTHVHPES